jgi:hypothetical protein
MRTRRNILVVVALAAITLGFAIFGASTFTLPHRRILNKNQDYYSRLATACDSLLITQPSGTDTALEISTVDQTLPTILRELHPSKIIVSSNHVWIMAGVRDFGLLWEPQGGTNTNHWALSTVAEGSTHELYVAARPLRNN